MPDRAWIVLIAATGLAGLVISAFMRHRKMSVVFAVLVFTALGCLSYLRIPLERDSSRIGGKAETRLIGKIISPVQRSESGCRFTLRPDNTGPGLLRVFVDGACDDLNRGARVLFRARTRPPGGSGWRNPGSPDWAGYWRRKGVVAEAFVRNNDSVIILEDGSGLLALVDRARRKLSGVILGNGASDEKALILALASGDRSMLRQEIKENFRKAGIAHLLAISGLHVAGVAAMIFWLFSFAAGRFKRLLMHGDVQVIASTAALASCWAYAVFAGASPSTLRAAILATVLFGAIILKRGPDFSSGLGLAAVIILLLDPSSLESPSFQLTFAAVLAIVLLVPRISSLVERCGFGKKMNSNRAGRKVVGIFSVTLAALVGTLPLTLHHFGQASLVGLASNLIAVPLAGLLVVPSALVSALVGLAWPGLVNVPLYVAEQAARLLIAWAGLFSRIPGASLEVAKPGWLFVAGFYLTVWALVTARKRRWRLVAGSCLALLLLAAIYGPISPLSPKRLSVTFLDVGDGDAMVLRFPGGRSALIDAGPGRNSRMGITRPGIVPALAELGVSSLDAVFLSHGHEDHAGGLGEIFRLLRVDDFVHENKARLLEAGTLALDAAQKSGVNIETASRGRSYSFPGATIHVLYPGPGDEDMSVNDHSMVLKLVMNQVSFLFTGDIEEPAEERLLESGVNLEADVLKLAHHGSNTSSSPAFLNAVRPKVAVASTARASGLPSEQVRKRLERIGTITYSTVECGAITVSTDGEDLHVETVVSCKPLGE